MTVTLIRAVPFADAGQALKVDLPHLQVAMETKQDPVGVAMEVEQRGHQRCQNSELIDLQRKPKKKKSQKSSGS